MYREVRNGFRKTSILWIYFTTEIHSMQGWASTTRHGVQEKEAQKH